MTAAETCSRPGRCITAFTAPAQTTRDADRQWSVCTVVHWPSVAAQERYIQWHLGRAVTGCSATQDGHYACTHWGRSMSAWLTVCISSRAAWLPIQGLLWCPYNQSCKPITPSTCCCQLMTPTITCNVVAAPVK